MLSKTFWLAIGTAAITASTVLLILPEPTAKQFDLLIKNADIYIDGDIEANVNIAVSDGVIKAVGAGVSGSARDIIDAQDKTLIPGLTDAHTHTYGNALQQALKFGVTSQIDMFTAPELLQRAIEQRNSTSNSQNADLFSSGVLATAPKGHGTQFGISVETLTQPDQAEAWVARRKAEGSDFIKLVYMPNNAFFHSLDKATATAVINAGHRAGLKVVAHISSQQGAQDMLDAQIDGLVHQFADSEVSESFLQQAVQQRIFVIPTLSVIGAVDHQSFSSEFAEQPKVAQHLNPSQKQRLSSRFGAQKLPGFDYHIASQNTKKMLDAGITILAGSDAPNPGTTFGASLHQELQLLVDAGFTNSQALNAATGLPITAFGIADRGEIKTGHRANILILNSSPLDNIQSTLDINKVIKNGHIVNRDQVQAATQPTTISNGSLSNFASGLNNEHGMQWGKTDDSIRQGQSVASIKLKDNTLYVNAQVEAGFMFPWAGAGVFSEQRQDISRFKTLSFKVRGTPGQYTALAFSGSDAAMPARRNFKVSQTWQTIELSLADFAGFNTKELMGLAFVVSPQHGKFEYYLDDVKLKQ